MGNKLDKFLISLSGIMMVTLGVMGLKFQKESADIKKLQENLKGSLASAEKVRTMIDIQRELEAKRMENLQKADAAQLGTKTKTSTQRVVIPGKTVKQTTTSSGSSSSSSSSKTTKSS